MTKKKRPDLKGWFWIETEDGQKEQIPYAAVDDSLLPKILQPVGGFCWPADVFVSLPLETPPFHVQGWLPRPGKLLFFGKGGVRKSFLSMYLARCIGCGEPFLGLKTEKGVVLYIQFELGEALLQERMVRSGKEYSDVFVGTTFSMKLDTKKGMEQLDEALGAVRPSVVIIDPFYKAFSGEETTGQDVQKVFDHLDMLIQKYNCSMVVIHHGGKDLSRGARGHSVFLDWPDSYIEVKEDRQHGGITLTPIKLRHVELTEPIKAVFKDSEFEVSENQDPTVQGQVLKWLQEHGGRATIDELVEAGIGAKRTVYGAVSALAIDGQVLRPERGVVILPPPD